MPKWLLLQMTRTGTTYSKEEKVKAFFFLLLHPQKMVTKVSKTAIKYQNVGQMLPNLGFEAKEKTLTTCFVSH